MAMNQLDEMCLRCGVLFSNLKSERSLYEPTNSEIKQLFDPFSGDLMQEHAEGDDRLGPVHDTTGMHYGHMLLNFILARIFPAGAQWLRLDLARHFDRTRDLQGALDRANQRFTGGLDLSNFFEQNISTVWEHLILGNAAAAVEPFFDGDGAPFSVTSLDFGRVWRRSNRAGRVEVIAVEYIMTAGEAFDFFERKPGPKVLDILKNGDASAIRKVKYLHLVERNSNYVAEGLRLPSKKKWISRWISMEDGFKSSDGLIQVSGLDRSPYVTSCWRKVRGEEYGRGLGHLARADAAGLNASYRLLLNAWATDLDPPWMVASRDQMTGQLGPQGLVVVRQGWITPAPIRSGTDYNAAASIFDRQRGQIREIFMADALMPPDTQERSAQATIARQTNQLTRLATFAASIKDFLADQVKLIVEHMYDAGQFPELEEIADALGGRSVELVPVFVSPFFAAQRLAAAQQTIDYVAAQLELSNLSKSDDVAQELLSTISFSQYSEVVAELGSAHHGIFLTKQQAEKKREATAMRKAQESMMQQAQMTGPLSAPETPSLLGRA